MSLGSTVNTSGGVSADGGDRVVVLGLSWSSGEPTIRLRNLSVDGPHGDKPSTSTSPVDTPARGLELAYRVVEGSSRHCLGSAGLNTVCDNPVQGGSKRCARCSIAEAMHASSLHHAHTRDPVDIDPDVRKHLAQPNDLYLAAFRDGSMKVGTSTSWRTDERLVEQGAWLAVVVARSSNGYDIRNLEDAVTEHLGVPQSVNSSRKVAGLLRPVDDTTLTDKLMATAEQIKTLPAFELLALPDSEMRSWSNLTALSGDRFQTNLHRYPHRLDQGAHRFQIIDVCGRLAIVIPDTTDDALVVDLGQLFGVEQEIGRFTTDELALQGSLF